MRIAELYARGGPVCSFEFFPPKTDEGYQALYATIGELKRLEPGFVSVTCGAAGSTRRKTAELVVRIQRDLGLTAMAHVVCTGTTPDELEKTLGWMRDQGIQNVLTLRGDPPRDQPEWRPAPGGFSHANELAAFVRARFDFCIGGACYPEKHPEAPSPEQDLAHLKRKVDAGAEFLITQLFFDAADYWSFVARARTAGIVVPIVPGVMPIVSGANLRRMASLSPGSKIPDRLQRELDRAAGDDERALEVGVRWATHQCRELLDRDAPGIHFYTLNRSPATVRVHEALFRKMSAPLRVAVLLSGEGTSLENLFERIAAGDVPARVELVIASKEDAGGLARARRRGVPAFAVPRKQFADVGAFNDRIHELLDAHPVDLVALLGFLSIFQSRGKYDGRVINTHPALVPAFSGKGFYGRRVHEAVLARGCKVSGATVHFCDDEYDHGPILLQEAVPVLEDDTPDSLAARVQAAERRLVPEAIRRIAQGRARSRRD